MVRMRSARVTRDVSDAGRSTRAGLANIGTAGAASRRRWRTILQPGAPRSRVPRLCFALAVAAWSAAAPALAALPVGRDHRLILGFVEDGAIVGTGWFEAGFSAGDSGEGWDIRGTTLVALRYGRDVEAGFSLGGLHRERHGGAPLFGGTVEDWFSRTGADDALVYGK